MDPPTVLNKSFAQFTFGRLPSLVAQEMLPDPLVLVFYILCHSTVLGLLFTLYTYILIDTVLQTDYSKLRRQALASTHSIVLWPFLAP